MSELSWTPVRRGAIYCSPACGGGCTWAAYREATRRAKLLAAKLGPEWKPRVWENLGWHYAANTQRNEATLMQRDRRYMLFAVNSAFSGSLRAVLRAARRHALDQARGAAAAFEIIDNATRHARRTKPVSSPIANRTRIAQDRRSARKTAL